MGSFLNKNLLKFILEVLIWSILKYVYIPLILYMFHLYVGLLKTHDAS